MLDYSPANARRQELCEYLVISWWIDCANQIAGLQCKFESLRIQLFRDCRDARLFNAAEGLREDHNQWTSTQSTKQLHLTRLLQGELVPLHFLASVGFDE